MTQSHAQRDGGRPAAQSMRKLYEEPQYDPDWAICPDGGSNNRWDYERHFPTCQGYKCLYSCDAAWDYYQGLDAPLDFSYEITIKSGVSGSLLTAAILEMEERMLINMATAVGIDDCICSTMNSDGRGGYRALRKSAATSENKVEKKPRKMQGRMPEGQHVVNLSNLIKDDILAGKCKKTTAPEGEACIRMGGHMRFVHTVDVDDEETRRLTLEGALGQLNDLLFEGMQDGIFLDQDVPEEERIITGITFVPEEVDPVEGDPAEGGEGDSDSWGTVGTAPINPGEGIEGDSDSWGTAGTAPINPGKGLENIDQETLPGPEDTIPIGGPAAPAAATGRSAGNVSYGIYGLFVLVALAIVAVIGLFMRRRQNKDDEEEGEDGEVEEISAGSASLDGAAKSDGSFPTKEPSAYDLTEVKAETEEITVGTSASDTVGASACEEGKMVDEEKMADVATTDAA